MVRFPILGDSRPLRAGHDFIAAPNSGSGHVGGPFSAVPIVRLDTLVFTDAAAQQQLLHHRWYSGGYVLRAADERRLPSCPCRSASTSTPPPCA